MSQKHVTENEATTIKATASEADKRKAAACFLSCVCHLENATAELEKAGEVAAHADRLVGTETADEIKLALSFARAAERAIIDADAALGITEIRKCDLDSVEPGSGFDAGREGKLLLDAGQAMHDTIGTLSVLHSAIAAHAETCDDADMQALLFGLQTCVEDRREALTALTERF